MEEKKQIRIENSQLNIEQLGEVNGGKDMGAYLPENHGRHIGMYEAEAYIDRLVYVVKDLDREEFYWGKLKRSYEQERCGCTWRTHVIDVMGCNDYWTCCSHYVGCEREFRGDNVTLFLMVPG